jgi:teichuronic acid biosynthesis glycosyltransferase TuaC
MLKVAVITQHFPVSHQQWAGHSAYQTLRVLARRCTLRVFYPHATYPTIVKAARSGPPRLDPSYRPKDVDAEYIPYPALPLLSRPLNGWRAGRRLLPHVKRFRPDVVLSYVIYPDGYAALRIARELKVPLVVTAIGSDLNRISDRWSERLTRRVLVEADTVCTVSGHLLQRARSLGALPQGSRTILNGCDTSVFHPRDRVQSRMSLGVPAQGRIVVYVGRLDIRKGLRELVEAVHTVRARYPDLRCYIVGDGPDRPILLDAIRERSAQEFIFLKPSCPTQGVALWMGAADVFALPSYAEGCPNVVLEALASGRPVVASRVGGIPEIMDESVGRLVPPKDANALATALGDVLSLTWEASAIAGRNSRSWSDVADDLYATLLQAVALPTTVSEAQPCR